jgi:hypothetical protein
VIGRPRNFPAGYCSMCGLSAQHRTSTGTYYCSKHHRFIQMRSHAKFDGKAVPSYQQLELLMPSDMRCAVCVRRMNWLAKDGKATQITLQHDHDGRLRLICFGCNSRHARLPGDLLYALKPDERYCHKCKSVKSIADFYRSNYLKRTIKLSSRCKSCLNKSHAEWRRHNSVHAREYQRKWHKRMQETR